MSSTDDEENMYESQGNLFEENTDYDTLKISDHCTKNWSFQEEETADSVTFTEEILNGKLQFLCSGFKW